MDSEQKSGTHRFSIVMTATRSGTESFKTLDDMPPILRATCLKALQSPESKTLVIADEAGREAMLQQSAEEGESAPVAELRPQKRSRVSGRLALEILLCGAVGLAVWLVATLR